MIGSAKELTLVNDQIGTLPHKIKIAIAGNHDNGLDINQYDELVQLKRAKAAEDPVENRKLLSNMTVLYDELIELDNGIKIWGSPYTPEFNNWAFALKTT